MTSTLVFFGNAVYKETGHDIYAADSRTGRGPALHLGGSPRYALFIDLAR
jgi:hypothetical protein